MEISCHNCNCQTEVRFEIFLEGGFGSEDVLCVPLAELGHARAKLPAAFDGLLELRELLARCVNGTRAWSQFSYSIESIEYGESQAPAADFCINSAGHPISPVLMSRVNWSLPIF